MVGCCPPVASVGSSSSVGCSSGMDLVIYSILALLFIIGCGSGMDLVVYSILTSISRPL